MKKANFKGLHIRKWYLQVEETHANETGMAADGKMTGAHYDKGFEPTK